LQDQLRNRELQNSGGQPLVRGSTGQFTRSEMIVRCPISVVLFELLQEGNNKREKRTKKSVLRTIECEIDMLPGGFLTVAD
jgi:hypothetical protein